MYLYKELSVKKQPYKNIKKAVHSKETPEDKNTLQDGVYSQNKHFNKTHKKTCIPSRVKNKMNCSIILQTNHSSKFIKKPRSKNLTTAPFIGYLSVVAQVCDTSLRQLLADSIHSKHL
ncbi:MAG: hypothetical protein DA443_01605 [Bacteroidetes bacterium]|nr:MAG: hypothetical protein DA443_01605 [Bacteroidota bacterium]